MSEQEMLWLGVSNGSLEAYGEFVSIAVANLSSCTLWFPACLWHFQPHLSPGTSAAPLQSPSGAVGLGFHL